MLVSTEEPFRMLQSPKLRNRLSVTDFHPRIWYSLYRFPNPFVFWSIGTTIYKLKRLYFQTYMFNDPQRLIVLCKQLERTMLTRPRRTKIDVVESLFLPSTLHLILHHYVRYLAERRCWDSPDGSALAIRDRRRWPEGTAFSESQQESLALE